MTVQWNGDKVLAAVRGATVTGLTRGTEAVRDEAVSLINSGAKTGRIYRRGGVVHRASAPGESPAGDTGDLASKIGTSVDPQSLIGSIEFYSGHAAELEFGTSKMAPRPFARVAVIHQRDVIEADISEEIAKALR